MSSPTEPVSRREVGNSLNLSDQELDRLAQITEADILKTQQTWEQGVDNVYKNLLLAERS